MTFDANYIDLPERAVLAMENFDWSSDTGKFFEAKIKKNKKKLYPEFIRMNNSLVISRFLSFWKKVSLDDLEIYLNEATSAKCPSSTAVLLEYKQKYYSPKEQEQKQEDDLLKSFGMKERSLADWRKIFKIAIRDGTAVITQYIGEDPFVEIPEKVGKNPVTGLDVRAFERQKSVTDIVLNKNLLFIERAAFDGCTSLTNITIPASVKNIGGYVFERCTQLNAIEVDGRNGKYQSIEGILYDKSKNLLIRCPLAKSGRVDIPSNVQSIMKYAFYQCSSVTEISIPDGVTTIEEQTFGGCSSLQAIIMPENALSLIDKFAFENCKQLKEITLKHGVNKIFWKAFAGCESLTCVELGEGTEMLGKEAFLNCTNLTDIYLPNSLMKIGDACFTGCVKLTIHAPSGSFAEQYAKENEIDFVAVE